VLTIKSVLKCFFAQLPDDFSFVCFIPADFTTFRPTPSSCPPSDSNSQLQFPDQTPDSISADPSCSDLDFFISTGSQIVISFLPELSLAFMITYLLGAVSVELSANRPPKALATEC